MFIVGRCDALGLGEIQTPDTTLVYKIYAAFVSDMHLLHLPQSASACA